MLGKTSASPRKCGTIAARSSGTNIVLKGPGLGLRRLGRNGSRARAVVDSPGGAAAAPSGGAAAAENDGQFDYEDD